MRLFLIYVLKDPRFPNDIRYCGITFRSAEKRLSEHIYKSKWGRSRKAEWIKELIRDGVIPIIEVVHTGESEDDFDWREEEAIHIDYYQKTQSGLLNDMGGGFGRSQPSAEFSKRLSASLKAKYKDDPSFTERNRIGQKKRFEREEEREKCRESTIRVHQRKLDAMSPDQLKQYFERKVEMRRVWRNDHYYRSIANETQEQKKARKKRNCERTQASYRRSKEKRKQRLAALTPQQDQERKQRNRDRQRLHREKKSLAVAPRAALYQSMPSNQSETKEESPCLL